MYYITDMYKDIYHIIFYMYYIYCIFFLFSFYILNLLYFYRKYNNTLPTDDIINISNKYYLDILYESYSKTPNIKNILHSIRKYYKDKSTPLFFLLDGIRIYAKSIRMINITGKLSNKDGDIGMVYYQMKNYNQIIKYYDSKNKIKNICEIGFQLGAGALTLITSVKHEVNYYGFDYGNKYSKDAFDIIYKIFKMNMIWGDSQISIPRFYNSNKSFTKCDVVHIDGCHAQNVIYNDIVNMKKISHPHSLLLLDDVFSDSSAIKRVINNHLIKNLSCYKWKPYCIAIYS